MAIYHANEFVANLPDSLKDKSINIFSLTDDGPSEIAVVVARDVMKNGEDLDSFADRQLALVHPRLPLFRVMRVENVKIDNHTAKLVDCTWHPPEGKMHQRQVMIPTRMASRVVLILSVTTREKINEKAEKLFQEFTHNFRLRS